MSTSTVAETTTTTTPRTSTALRTSIRNSISSSSSDAAASYTTCTLPCLMAMAKQDVLHKQLTPAHSYFEIAIETAYQSEQIIRMQQMKLSSSSSSSSLDNNNNNNNNNEDTTTTTTTTTCTTTSSSNLLAVDKTTLLMYNNIVKSVMPPNGCHAVSQATDVAVLGDVNFWLVSQESHDDAASSLLRPAVSSDDHDSSSTSPSSRPATTTTSCCNTTTAATVTSNNGDDKQGVLLLLSPLPREPFLCFDRFLKTSPRYNLINHTNHQNNARNNLLFYNDLLQLERLCVPGMEELYVEKYLQIYSTYFASANGEQQQEQQATKDDGSDAISPIDLNDDCRRQIVNYHAKLEAAIL
eukprot:CAMPEP_0119031316 /NCGR_PEP_ID=MMETSP1176-20130426/41482_1 /TAXON_ID=265551 /ORGANISM="Synedropsis recta cf, Strain CCMP1620" /LENGTH=353 /DNA_ID=CAMNT_0006987709 /DNA_START=155 /DNA_END=1216 /DNA_ORIENTATION=-